MAKVVSISGGYFESWADAMQSVGPVVGEVAYFLGFLLCLSI